MQQQDYWKLLIVPQQDYWRPLIAPLQDHQQLSNGALQNHWQLLSGPLCVYQQPLSGKLWDYRWLIYQHLNKHATINHARECFKNKSRSPWVRWQQFWGQGTHAITSILVGWDTNLIPTDALHILEGVHNPQRFELWCGPKLGANVGFLRPIKRCWRFYWGPERSDGPGASNWHAYGQGSTHRVILFASADDA